MNPAMIDTDILSLFFRNTPSVIKNFTKYLKKYNKINISIITYYEILSGLKYKNLKNLTDKFLAFVKFNEVLPLTIKSVEAAAEIYKDLRQKGNLIEDIDILIAGIAKINKLDLITANEKHFKRIKELKVKNWAK